MGLAKRLGYAWRCVVAVLAHGALPDTLVHALTPEAVIPTAPPTSSPAPISAPDKDQSGPDGIDRAVQLLALLQREGRLVDFVMEDIIGYSDAQVGAAVRQVHEGCRQILSRYLELEPISASEEGQPVTVQEDVDPVTTKLIGNTTGTPPLRGVLRHRGWQVAHMRLPALPGSAGRAVVAPAEIEIP